MEERSGAGPGVAARSRDVAKVFHQRLPWLEAGLWERRMHQVRPARRPVRAPRPERCELNGANPGFDAEGVHLEDARQRDCVNVGMRLQYGVYSTC